MENPREGDKREVLGVVPLSIVDFRPSEDCSGEGERGAGHDGWLGRDEVAVVKGDLADVSCHVFHLLIVPFCGNEELGEEVDRGVAYCPLERVKNMHLHLSKHAGIVEPAAHVVQLMDLWNAVFLIAILGSDQQGCTADELVVLFIHHPF